MSTGRTLVATAATSIHAAVDEVWHALVDPASIKKYMFGTDVLTTWAEGEPIRWRGEWQGAAYEDMGTVLRVEKPRLLSFSHFSPLSGEADLPENYHTVTIALSSDGRSTRVTLTQDNNPDEDAREHSARNWESMLASLKDLLEEGGTDNR
jgi:uncharacterized protein YndB with AHSA1/START domain